MTPLNDREIFMEPCQCNALCLAYLHRHVRLVQVPVDHIRVHKGNRLGTTDPIMDAHWSMQCAHGIVSHSIDATLRDHARLGMTGGCNAASEVVISTWLTDQGSSDPVRRKGLGPKWNCNGHCEVPITTTERCCARALAAK